MATSRFASLSEPGFRLFCIGNFGSLIGTWAQRVAMMWLAWDLSQSPVTVGLLAILDLLPALFSSPFGGSLADRPDRVKMAVYVQYLSILPPLALFGLAVSGLLTIEWLLMITVLGGLLNGIDHPMRLSLVSSLVPPERVPGAVSINSVIFNISRMVDPAIGGVAIAAGLMSWVFIANLLSFLFFAATLRRIKVEPEEEDADPLSEGKPRSRAALPWSQVWRNLPAVQALTLLYLSVVCFCLRPVYEMLPVFASRLFSGEAEAASAFAMMSSSVGLGALIGAVIAPEMRSSRVIFLVGAGGAIAIGALAFTSSLWLTLLALTLSSVAILSSSIATQILLQTQVSPQIRGKVLAVYAMILRAFPATGALLAGIAAVRFDLGYVFLISGLPVLAVALVLTQMAGRRGG